MAPLPSSRAGFSVGLWRRLRAADASLMAAAVAFNTFFALVPAAAVVVAAASLLASDPAAVDRVARAVEPLVPGEVAVFARSLVDDVGVRLGGSRWTIIVGGVLVALYAGSRAMMAMQRALARLEGMRENRPRWQIRLIGVGLTLAAAAALAASSLLLVGDGLNGLLLAAGAQPLGTAWTLLRVPLAAMGLLLFLRLLYRWGPPRPLPASWTAALVGTLGTMAASLGFGLYLGYAHRLGATVGTLGAVAVALAWLYLGAYATLVGAGLVTSAWRIRRDRSVADPLLVEIVAPDREPVGVGG